MAHKTHLNTSNMTSNFSFYDIRILIFVDVPSQKKEKNTKLFAFHNNMFALNMGKGARAKIPYKCQQSFFKQKPFLMRL